MIGLYHLIVLKTLPIEGEISTWDLSLADMKSMQKSNSRRHFSSQAFQTAFVSVYRLYSRPDGPSGFVNGTVVQFDTALVELSNVYRDFLFFFELAG